ncbi:MAG: hypothetical protein WBI07_01465 [Mobilitalea sp.]
MDKNLRKNLKLLFDAIIKEAEENKEFANTLSSILDNNVNETENKTASGTRRGGNRRDKAIFDPIKLAEENILSKEMLDALSEKELKDIIAEYGMDPSKLAMKWKDKERIIQLILDTAMRRASKGDACRG